MNENLPDLKDRTKKFALRTIRMYAALPRNDTVAQVLGKQVLRSATSVGANYREASQSRSKPEFTSKTGDCLKEIVETEYWLELLVESGTVPAAKMADLLDETRQLIAIFTTIVREDLRENKPMDAAEFAVHLDDVRNNCAPPDYQKPDRFFARTYLTRNLSTLASEVISPGSARRRVRSSTWQPNSVVAKPTR